MKKIRVAIIDDHSIVRLGIKLSLRLFKDLEFVGEATDGEHAAEFVAKTQPDVTLLDIRMPRKNGVDALADILEANPAAKVAMLTTSGTDEDIYRALKLGAKGYVLKAEAANDVIEAIRTIAAGGLYIPEPVRVVYDRRAAQPSLNEQETTTLAMAAQGMNNSEIAAAFKLAPVTIKVRMSAIFAKLGVADRVSAVNEAIARGILPPRA
ncbi:MAG: response regulator [Kiritimatiellia bacterium]